ncbi:unnamed protein product, partial [Trichogramma brassicae]
MEKLRFEFVMKAAADKKSNALMVTSITTPDGEIFDIPAELQEVSLHTELMKTDIYKKIKNTNLKRNQKRNVWILLNAELKAAKSRFSYSMHNRTKWKTWFFRRNLRYQLKRFYFNKKFDTNGSPVADLDRKVVLGIVSGAANPCASGIPESHTKVSDYLMFILYEM